MSDYRRSKHLSRFRHGEYHYLYHDLYGYILQMSEDVLSFLDRFREPMSEEAAQAAFEGTYPAEDVRRFVSVFEEYGCLIAGETSEYERLWQRFPVRGKWSVYRRTDEGRIVIYWSDGETAERRELTGWETAFWDSIDGDTQLSAVYAGLVATAVEDEEGGAPRREDVLSLVQFLAHSDRQSLKLSEFPMGFYNKEARSTPPYLLSFVPYERVADESGPGSKSAAASDAPTRDVHLERAERSFYHLCREPGRLFKGKSYGVAFAEALLGQGVLRESPRRVLDLSMDFGDYTKDLWVSLEPDAELVLLARDEADEARYMEAFEAHRGDVPRARLRFLRGTPDAVPEVEGPFDLIVLQETLGSLEHVSVKNGNLKGDVAKMAKNYNLFQAEAAESFLFNIGSVRLVEALHALLAPSGKVVIVDYGEEYQRPTMSTTSEIPYYLVCFGELKSVARSQGFSTFYTFMIDFVDFDRDRFTLSTNRHHFTALGLAMADVGVDLKVAPYTAEEFAARQKGVEVGNVFFEKAEDRCFGTVPHQLKVLVLGRDGQVEL
jgi:hypothetical protein